MKKVIVISGGTSGLGKAIAESLSNDYRVIILSPNKKKLVKTVEQIKCDFEVCDVADEESIKLAVKNVISKHRRIDCLINNAGIWVEGELTENKVERIKEVTATNALGAILLTKEIVPQMKKQGRGLIIIVNSQAGLYGKADRSVYTASKWALTGFTKSLQFELPKYGIRVTGLYPGKMKTNLFSKVGINKDMADALQPKEVAKVIQFILSLKDNVILPEVGVKHIDN
ncbi:MAG: SDR family oxidoreductase [bacterium]|nr:SDR family oxidoreductase [bacterium]